MKRTSGWLVAFTLLLATACGAVGPEGTDGTSGAVTNDIVVLADSSLALPFTELAGRFEAEHPTATVTLHFATSEALVSRLDRGYAADVLATADDEAMDEARSDGTVGPAAVFARNRFAILVADGNPHGVRGLADLRRREVTFASCDPEAVPCGDFGAELLETAGLSAEGRRLEPNVKSTVFRVLTGQADAGIVYVTDVKAVGDAAEAILIPESDLVLVRYSIAPAYATRHLATAEAFVTYIQSPDAQAVLWEAGFEPPSP